MLKNSGGARVCFPRTIAVSSNRERSLGHSDLVSQLTAKGPHPAIANEPSNLVQTSQILPEVGPEQRSPLEVFVGVLQLNSTPNVKRDISNGNLKSFTAPFLCMHFGN